MVATLALALSSAVAAPSRWESSIAASAPLNWYRLDETSGRVAFDRGSEGRNGTYGGGAGAPALGKAGLTGGAVEFDGTPQNILFNAPPLGGDWTAEFVLKKTGTKVSAELIRGAPLESPSSHLKLEQYENTGQVGFTESFLADRTFSPNVYAPVGEFIHLVFVNNSAGMKAYLNGKLAGSSDSSIGLYRYQFGDTGGEAPKAVVDEIVVYHRALPAEEIARHFVAIPEPGTHAIAGWLLTMTAVGKPRKRVGLGP